MTTVWQF